MTNGTRQINSNVQGKNMDLTPAISDYLYKKMSQLEKHLPQTGDAEVLAEVEVGLQSRHHKKGDIYRAETNLRVDGKTFRSVAKQHDLYVAIDEMIASLERSVRRASEKKQDFMRRGAAKAKALLKGLRRG